MQAMKVGLQHASYVPRMDHNAMLPYLARAARDARMAKARKQVHVAASLDRDQSTVARFEKAAGGNGVKIGWPTNPDAMVAAYADDLDISPLEIWRTALDLWASEQPPAAEPADRLVDPPPFGEQQPTSQARQGRTAPTRRGTRKPKSA